MTERYSRLLSIDGPQYATGSPVLMESGALLRDNANGKILALLKFRSITPKQIKLMTVDIICSDAMHRQLGSPIRYQYLDLNITRNEYFGAKQPIPLPDVSIRNISIQIVEVGFDDLSICTEISPSWQKVPERTTIDTLFPDIELRRQFSLSYGSDCQFNATRFEDLWYCTCGALNLSTETVCHSCKREFLTLTDADLEKLTFEKAARLAEEKRKEIEAERIRIAKEEADRIEAERSAAEHAAKMAVLKRFASIFFGIIFAIVSVIHLVTFIIIPNNNYQSAVALMDENQYEEALTAFENLNGYKDSEELVEKCKIGIKNLAYDEAIALKTATKYNEAIDAFSAMNGYRDSEDQIVEIQYFIALNLKETKKYDEAIVAFQALGNYKDSPNQIKDSLYLKAEEYLKSEDYKSAFSVFSTITDYKDVADQIATVTALRAEAREKALPFFKTIGSIVTYGHYEQDNNVSNGKEPIEWIVLKHDNKTKKSLLISRYCLDAYEFSSSEFSGDAPYSWAASGLRMWLNSTFIDDAFSSDEQAGLILSKITAPKWVFRGGLYYPNDGEYVQDKVWLLTLNEANQYFRSDIDRQSRGSNFAKYHGLQHQSGKCCWWVRSRGIMAACPESVCHDGTDRLDLTMGMNLGVRPVIWLDLNKADIY